MPNPFDKLTPAKTPAAPVDNSQEWSGQFSCQFPRCYGYAKIANYDPREKTLTWKCQEGHESVMEEVEE